MNPPTPAIPLVALVGATAEDLSALRPAAEVLASFHVVCVEHLAGQPLEGQPCAWIVASEDGTLPAFIAAETCAPVIRVPIPGNLSPLESLAGAAAWPEAGSLAPFATVALGEAGVRNAALLVVAILALGDERLRDAWRKFRTEQTAAVMQIQPLGRGGHPDSDLSSPPAKRVCPG